ncbi:MAG: DHH family phosphoesterase, partial [Chloroflexota bacterium]|nr:DHH family phosphoesterase [Chloroflexota bacterium]
MNIPKKKWQVSPRIPQKADADLHGYPPILRQILYNRGCGRREKARQYLEAQPSFDTDPFQLIGIPQAVDRLLRAIQENETIAIYGDYDVDGVSATALLVQYLSDIGAKAIAYIPDRFDEGYGLNIDAITKLEENGANLIITVDCGIRAIDEAEYARQLGLDLIVTDHHHAGEKLPDALAVIDPKQPNAPYPEKNLAGVGVAYKLVAALDTRISAPKIEIESYLDLVALGTVA